jgi:hypothetical protein
MSPPLADSSPPPPPEEAHESAAERLGMDPRVMAAIEAKMPGGERFSVSRYFDIQMARFINADGQTPIALQIAAGKSIDRLLAANMGVAAARQYRFDLERARLEAERSRSMMTAESAPAPSSVEPNEGQVGYLEILEIPSNGTEAPGREPLRLRPAQGTIDVEVVESSAGSGSA